MDNQTQAESSTATIEIPAAGSPEYKHYKLTGELPQKETSVARTAERESTAGGEAESASAPEAGTTQEHTRPQRRRSNAETRIQELLAENKRLKAEAGQRGTETRTETKTAESSTAAQPAKLEPPKKPDAKDFTVAKYGTAEKAWEAYEAAKDEYFEKLTDYKSNLAVQRDRQQRDLDAKKKALDEEIARGEKRYGKEKLGEFIQPTATAIWNEKEIPLYVKNHIAGSPVLVDLMYVFAGDKAQFDAWLKLAKSDPSKAIRVADEMERWIAEELTQKKSSAQASTRTVEEIDSESEQNEEDEESLESGEIEGEEGEEEDAGEIERDGKTGRFKKTPARKITQAPGPTREVKGTNTAPADEAQAALDRGDFAGYRRIKNAQDLKRRGQKA